ncbi:unnamed protein product [Kuraishia capsulata CBS 1993]|uniref:Xylanolytic transcriptional activator regulatory domain-containing protein n=1 Tax=Kuraishia capsulata CBS 1993 TaxID=1382522 RepID=W6MQC5_9ASCO|nr:uncharacterized protein KUCA_T00004881001 [Kuraishia capsulata CBS 1993]CDK28896.1 unnamed protein product [Kuraishia capsulata CBS 1993]
MSVGLAPHTSNVEYFGPASNFSFVNQLNHYLRQLAILDLNTSEVELVDERQGLERYGMKMMQLQDHTSSRVFGVCDISLAKAVDLVEGYFETWHVPIPLFKTENVMKELREVWFAAYEGKTVDKALLAKVCLLLSIGSGATRFDSESPDDCPGLARDFYHLAREYMPKGVSEVSYSAAVLLLLMSLAEANLGDTSLSYVHSGTAVRTAIVVGLHKIDISKQPTEANKECHRAWCSISQWDKYWSFCVGKPPSGLEDYPSGQMYGPAFACEKEWPENPFPIHYEHMRMRVFFGGICSRVYSELYDKNKDLLSVFTCVEMLSKKVDNEYFGTAEPYMCASDVSKAADNPIYRNREWFWIRIYYLYLKLVIFRPFLVFCAYLKLSSTETTSEIQQLLTSGSESSVKVAITLARFVIDLNRAVPMRQPILFICTYLESACTVLLFYVVSHLKELTEEMSHEIWTILNDTCQFLRGANGPNVGSTKLIANDAIKSLQNILLTKQSTGTTFFDRLMQPLFNRNAADSPLGAVVSPNVVVSDTKQPNDFFGLSTTTPQDSCDETESPRSVKAPPSDSLEVFWQQTLDWMSYP